MNSTEELGLQMFKEVRRGLDSTLLPEVSPRQFGRLDKDRLNPIMDQFESGGGMSLPGSTRSARTTDF